jgi:membrane-associated phospholipid phosphatase
MHARLIADAWRTPLAVVSAAAVALLAVLGVLVHRSSTSFDTWMFRELYNHIGAGAASALLDLSTPALSIGLLGIVVVFAALFRHWNLAVLAALGPAVAVVITKYVLKPHIGRRLTFGTFSVRGVFPSGHETAVSATAIVLLVVACQVPMRRRTRGVIVAVLAVWTTLAAVGLVRNFWHYATDTIGALCVSVAVVPALALLIDRYAARVQRRLRTPASVS